MDITKELKYTIKFGSEKDSLTITDTETGQKTTYGDGDALEIVSEINAVLARYC